MAQFSVGANTLQASRVTEATAAKLLAVKQKSKATTQKQAYQGWIDAGVSATESALEAAYVTAGSAKAVSIGLGTALSIARLSVAAADATSPVGAGVASAIVAAAVPISIVQAVSDEVQVAAETSAQVLSLQSSYERRAAEWQLGAALAGVDEQIGDQQIEVAQDQLDITAREQAIATVQRDQSTDMVNFLASKFTNADLYRWMSGVLGGVYAYFLQQATSVAALAQQQLNFERQQFPGVIIKDDYWAVPANPGGLTSNSNSADRRGLTGSARLLQDIYELDQFAFETNKRKLNLSHTISLAISRPDEFGAFRESGVLGFNTSLAMFDEAFPGHYLRLIKRVRTTVVALIPPVSGIRATLTASGISYVVVSGDLFQEITIRRDAESVALTSPINATGVFDLDAQSELLLPFESMGVATAWQFSMPKAANGFDFSTIPDVLLTMEYTALSSDDYRRQVIQGMPTRTSADRAYSVRQDFPDIWYELSNPTPGSVQLPITYRSERAHFPPNLSDLRVSNLLFALVAPSDDRDIEGAVSLTYAPDGQAVVQIDQPIPLVQRRISTRLPVGGLWRDAISQKGAIGFWAFSLSPSIAAAIADGQVDDVLIVETFEGLRPAWPDS